MNTRLLVCLGLLLSALLTTTSVAACSCVPDFPPFLEAAQSSPVVAIVEGQRLYGGWFRKRPRYADLKVIRYLKGSPDSDLIVLEGSNGAECRHYASYFKPGQQWVVALNRVVPFNPRRPRYSVSICSASALPLVDGQVLGQLSRASKDTESPLETVPLEAFVQRLAEHVATQ